VSILTTGGSMLGKRYTDEFKDEAVRLIRERKYTVSEVCEKLGVTANSLYK
jgi:transposase